MERKGPIFKLLTDFTPDIKLEEEQEQKVAEQIS
jgi:hypothetical protein